MSKFWRSIAGWAALGAAQLPVRRDHTISRPAPESAMSFLPYDWQALVTRFSSDGGVDYATFVRVRRLMEVHLDRLSEARPDLFASADERLAFYLNAYNAIAVYQVLLHYPVGSVRDIPGMFTRPFPVGHENLSLQLLFHRRIRGFGDPRVHAAIVPATVSAPRLRAYAAETLQQDLYAQTRELLADRERGARPMPTGRGVVLNPIFRRYAGDFITPGAMPGLASLVRGWLAPRAVLDAIRVYAPSSLRPLMSRRDARVAFLTYDWSLNDTTPHQAILPGQDSV